MPQVPDTDQTATTLPQGQLAYNTTQASPDTFGAGVARGVGQAAQGAEQVSQSAEQIEQRVGAVALGRAYSSLEQAYNQQSFGDGQNKGFYSLQGQDALNGYQAAQDKLEQTRQQIAATLPANLQAQFDGLSRRLTTYTSGMYGRHFVQQQEVAGDQADNISIDTDRQSAVLYRNDPTRFQASLAGIRDTVIQQGQRKGWSPEITDYQVQAETSKTIAGAIEADAQADPVKAYQHLQASEGSMLPGDYVALQQRLKPALFATSARNEANAIMSGNAGQTAQAVQAEAQRQGVDPTLALTTARIESNMGTRTQNPTSAASGVFGMMPSTWAANGGNAANRNDPAAQVNLGVQNLARSQQQADAAVGGHAEPWQVYLTHQQGAAGGPALLRAADTESAVDALAPAYNGDRTRAAAAITGNGGTADMTAGQFRTMWQQRYAAASASVPTVPPTGSSAPAAAPGVPTSADPRDHVPQWMLQAQNLRDPMGGDDPAYSEMVQSHIRSQVGMIEYAQAQQQRADTATLLTGAMGDPSVMPSGTGAPPSMLGAGPPAKPTSLDQLLTTPTMRTAWARSTPEAQRSVMAMLEANAKGSQPQFTPQAASTYYALAGMAANDPDGFSRVNLADPGLVAILPHEQLLSLMHEQFGAVQKSAQQQQRQTNLLHALDVVKPDLLASGVSIAGNKAGSSQAQLYNQFTGRFSSAIDDWRAANGGKMPSDDNMKQIGQQLLMQGTERGTSSSWLPGALGGGDRNVMSFQTDPGKFAPTVPADVRTQISAAYQARHGGAMPTEQQVQHYFMLGQATQPRPALPRMPASTSAPAPGGSTQQAQATTGAP